MSAIKYIFGNHVSKPKQVDLTVNCLWRLGK